MKVLKLITLGIILSGLYGCGGSGGGEGATTPQKSSSVPSGISLTEKLQKQYNEKAKELIQIQEGYEHLYELMSEERRLQRANQFEEGKEQLNSLQRQIEALKNAEKISFLKSEEIKDRYRDRMDEVLIIKNDSNLMQTHVDLINLAPESLEQVEDKSIQRFEAQTETSGRQFKVYETKAFIYVQEV